MKLLLSWLKEFAPVDAAPEEIAARLTAAGLEVEALTKVAPALDGVVMGRVNTVSPHPGADNLTICAVDDGKSERTVVCGAANVAAGTMVALALPGTTLPGGRRIAPVTLRGVLSEGMICTEKELDVGDVTEEVMFLAGEGKAGTPIADALTLNDHLFHIAVTPNRPDCLGVIGIAREISALFATPLAVPEVSFPEASTHVKELLRVSVEEKELCPRYTARVITNLHIGPAPFRMRYRLRLMGMRPVNNVVDVTNYVMLEYGHPLHAFDLDTLAGPSLIARNARKGEWIITINGGEHTLKPDMLLIADRRKPVAVAGIMGGVDTQVATGTGSIVLESAFFQPASVRRTSKALNISTESSYRFERGTDYHGLVAASARAAQLICRTAGGKVCAGLFDLQAKDRPEKRVSVRLSRVNAVLASRLNRKRVCDDLAKLGMEAVADKETLNVTIPSYRVDINREIDLIEEIARMEGYGIIPETPPRGIQDTRAGSIDYRGRARVRDICTALGFSEAVCLSFMGDEDMKRLKWKKDSPLRRAVMLKNPVSSDFSYLRSSMLPPLMRCVELNYRRGIRAIRLFELGRVFLMNDDEGPPAERAALGIIGTGPAGRKNWTSSPREIDFFFLKGVLSQIAEKMKGTFTMKPVDADGYQPGCASELLIGETPWGIAGVLHPETVASYGIEGRVVFAQVDTAPLFRDLLAPLAYSPLPRYPSAHRDVAVVVDEAREAGPLVETVKSAVPDRIAGIEVFDLYRGAPIPPGKKGVALTLTLQSTEGTLGEKEITRIMEKVHHALTTHGCELRE